MERILVVEDEAIVAEDLRNTLMSLGYAPIGPCATGGEAIALAERTRPPLALTDIRLAGPIDGIETARRLGALHVGVIFVTAYDDDDTLARAGQITPYGYIVKPFDRRDLRGAIHVALYKRRMEEALDSQRELLASVLAGVAEAVVALDASGRIVLLNEAARALLRTTEEGRPPLADAVEILGPDLVPLARAIELGAAQGETFHLAPGSTLQIGGEEIPVDGSLSPMHDAHGRPAGGVLALRPTRLGRAVRPRVDAAAEREGLLQRVRRLI